MDHEKNIRGAANALQKAISDAGKAGYRVDWPTRPEGLGAVAISETGKVKPVMTVAPAVRVAPGGTVKVES